MTRDTHRGFNIAFPVSPSEILGPLSLLVEVQTGKAIVWKRHQTTLHSIPVSALPDGRQSVLFGLSALKIETGAALPADRVHSRCAPPSIFPQEGKVS